jgi:hypothetical protein
MLAFIAVSCLARFMSSIASFAAVAAKTPIKGTIEVTGFVGLIAEIDERIAITWHPRQKRRCCRWMN